jgi:hypothetical protein
MTSSWSYLLWNLDQTTEKLPFGNAVHEDWMAGPMAFCPPFPIAFDCVDHSHLFMETLLAEIA